MNDIKGFVESYRRVIATVDKMPNSVITPENAPVKILADWGRKSRGFEKLARLARPGGAEQLEPTEFTGTVRGWAALQMAQKGYSSWKDFSKAVEQLGDYLGQACDIIDRLTAEKKYLEECLADKLKLVREISDILHPNGDGPKHPSLCDVVKYVKDDFAKLTADLKKHGGHTPGCPAWHFVSNPCTCGWEQIEQGLNKKKEGAE